MGYGTSLGQSNMSVSLRAALVTWAVEKSVTVGVGAGKGKCEGTGGEWGSGDQLAGSRRMGGSDKLDSTCIYNVLSPSSALCYNLGHHKQNLLGFSG